MVEIKLVNCEGKKVTVEAEDKDSVLTVRYGRRVGFYTASCLIDFAVSQDLVRRKYVAKRKQKEK